MLKLKTKISRKVNIHNYREQHFTKIFLKLKSLKQNNFKDFLNLPTKILQTFYIYIIYHFTIGSGLSGEDHDNEEEEEEEEEEVKEEEEEKEEVVDAEYEYSLKVSNVTISLQIT